jgi:predicted RNA-binding Zn-ribbon protein involved in translation (DUF1610 family)
VLRFDAHGSHCDFCGYPRTHGTLTDALQGLEKDLRIKAQSLLERIKRPFSRQVFVYYPIAVRPCIACGVNIRVGSIVCPNCGTPQEILQATPVSRGNSVQSQGIERNVLDYIVSHNGTISLSQAAQELTLSQDVLQSAIERLKAAGFLNQT